VNGSNDPDNYERAELEHRLRAGLDPLPPAPPPSRRRFGRVLDLLDALVRSLGGANR
jgi:hypothetical protein